MSLSFALNLKLDIKNCDENSNFHHPWMTSNFGQITFLIRLTIVVFPLAEFLASQKKEKRLM
jgi:hypothetical protein